MGLSGRKGVGDVQRFWVACAGLVLAGSAWANVPSATVRADRIVIEKAARTLTLFAGTRRIAAYRVALGQAPVGHKHCQGDNRTPEGRYRISGRKLNSDFHRALRISYPEANDVAAARARGCQPGGDIMIHGLAPSFANLGPAHRTVDWTRGCVAVTNEEIEQIWSLVADGTPVEIRP